MPLLQQLRTSNEYETSLLQGLTIPRLYPDLKMVDTITKEPMDKKQIFSPKQETTFTLQSYITLLGQKKLFHIDVHFGNNLVRALVDSGASFSLISAKMAEWLTIQLQDIYPTDDKVLDASNASIKFMGIVELPIKIGRAKIHGTFCIWDNDTHEMILGQDFIQASSPITFMTNSFIFYHGMPPQSYKVPMKSDKGYNRVARIKHTTMLKERSNTMISVVVDDFNENHTVLFQPRSSFMIKQQLMCIPMVVDYVEGQMEILVMNNTDQPIKVYQQSRIGDISPATKVVEHNTIMLVQKQDLDANEEEVG